MSAEVEHPARMEDRRVRRTRAQLRTAFTSLMAEKPINQITVRELADRADVNRGTFYTHYRDIYDMLEQVEQELLDELTAVLDRYSAQELRRGIRPVLEEVFCFVRENAALCTALLESRSEQPFFQRVSDLLWERCMGEWRGIYPRLGEGAQGSYAMQFLVAGTVGLVRSWTARGFAEDPGTMAALAERLILSGIR